MRENRENEMKKVCGGRMRENMVEDIYLGGEIVVGRERSAKMS